ncbi:MAG: hypothetical protein ACPGWR_05030 [Ardenticatenaceae bacterium]
MSSHPLIDTLRKKPDQAAHHNGWTIEADQAKAGPVGIQTDALRLRRDTSSPHAASDLARKVAKRSTYLLEPLKLVEGEKRKALLRSDDPHAKGDRRDYYEVWVTPDDLSVQRYHSKRGQRREARPVNLTWEQAGRFVRDVENVYESESK